MGLFAVSVPVDDTCSEALLEVQSPLKQRDNRVSYPGALNSKWARWSSSGHNKSIYGSEFAGRLDFNQHTREASPALIPCLKSKAPSNKEINAYLIQGL